MKVNFVGCDCNKCFRKPVLVSTKHGEMVNPEKITHIAPSLSGENNKRLHIWGKNSILATINKNEVDKFVKVTDPNKNEPVKYDGDCYKPVVVKTVNGVFINPAKIASVLPSGQKDKVRILNSNDNIMDTVKEKELKKFVDIKK